MQPFLTLLHREWLQHRFGWTLLTLVPMSLAVLLLSFGQIELDDSFIQRAGSAFPAFVALASIAATTAITFAMLWMAAIILMTGLARRDHADRSIEFWLSLPAGHAQSLAAPLLMHLVLVPAAALLIGLAGGYLVSLVVVSRLLGFAAWAALPWGDIVAATLAVAGRMLIGLPLAMLWLLPIVLLMVLATAWFRRWGVVVLVVTLGLGNLALQYWFGAPLLNAALAALLRQAGQALIASGSYEINIQHPSELFAHLQALPGRVLPGIAGALRALASPLLAGGLLVSAALFALLVDWRRRGA